MRAPTRGRQTRAVAYGPEMRASDGDREKIVGRLRDAHVEGRLSADEFEDRLNAAYTAQTYGELEPLIRDIPVMRTHKTPDIVKPQQMPVPPPRGREGGGDRAMRVLWTIWACAVSINLVIWVLVSLGNGNLEYFWPMWVAGPWGAVLLTIDIIRRSAKPRA
ncbi:DUF1707 domain-containing protein [Flindersiella endophytica]